MIYGLEKKAIRTLMDSLYPIPDELNEQDWKTIKFLFAKKMQNIKPQ